MSHWDDLRKLARQHRAAALIEASGATTAEALLAAADRLTGFVRTGLPSGDPLLDGGEAVLDADMGQIWFNRDVEPRRARFYQAHEYAHLWLHRDHTTCQEIDFDGEASEEEIPVGVQRVEGYGPEERREREANVFAREFLLSTSQLRAWYVADGLDAPAIAARVGLPEGMILQQLARALLLPDLPDSPAISAPERAVSTPESRSEGPGSAGACPPPGPVSGGQAPALQDAEPANGEGTATAPGPVAALDPTQLDAAHADHGPLLVEAGPGTGKTRTLVGRIVFLLRRGVAPSEILALTFSNRAAEEMRQRVARAEPAAAPRIWMGTFHAFGLELLRKYGALLGLPPRPDILDPTDAVDRLERALPDLALDYYQNLYEPTTHLRAILGAISRAKDELIGPEEYAALADAMRERASSTAEIEAAEKAREVARVYAHYQASLDHDQLLDFGDLIFKAVVLLRSHETVRDELRRTYRQILVDEFQDVNRASGLLLRELAGAGEGLWIVGDARQAIYRFRGAAPANLRRFNEDFPGARTVPLGRNYRSQPAIVDVVSGFAPLMETPDAVREFTPWQAVRPDEGGRIEVAVADDLDAEGDGLAREISKQHADGIAYRDQAVLCRTHGHLGQLAARLERAGIPILYLGDLFERPEVRDLLALLSLASEGDGRGLIRVARFPEYQIPLADVLTLLERARAQEVSFPGALALAADAPALSAPGQAALARLAWHLAGFNDGARPWTLLSRYLFSRSDYLRPFLEDDSVAGQQRRLAIYQLLQFAHGYQPARAADPAADPTRLFLHYVRRLEIFGEEKQLRQVPGWADEIDAVRLLTVHASKGLEFRAVYLPTLGQGIFPSRRHASNCPPPEGMLAAEAGDHDAEEESLFFVALSRARDVLCLSRANRYGDQNRKVSTLLEAISPLLPTSPTGDATWPASAPPDETPPDPPPTHGLFRAEDLDTYIRCPRQYFYEVTLRLGGEREDSAYVRFHRCVYQVLRWLADEVAQRHPVDEAAARAYLAGIWPEQGPVDHPYAPIYRESAEALVARAAGRAIRTAGPAARPTWIVPLAHGQVRLTPDHVEARDDGGETVERLRTGRPSASEKNKDVYALYQTAAATASPRVPRDVVIRYLSTGDVESVNLSPRMLQTRLDHYDAAIAGILRQDFAPHPSDRLCPRCAYYFICPVAEDR